MLSWSSYSLNPISLTIRMTDFSSEELTAWALDELRAKIESVDRPLIISLSGAQGSGKSTQSARWAAALRKEGQPGLVLSLDDFYLSKAQRQKLAQEIHPLAGTRGPPGTHDTERLISLIKTLMRGDASEVSLPRFSKAHDDRLSDEVKVLPPLRWVIVEGWCLGISGARAQPEEVECRVFETTGAGSWKQWIEETIDDRWRALDALFDWSIYLRIPDFEAIVDARWRQEESLRNTSGRCQFETKEQVRDFVSIYEPWTLRMSQESEALADSTFNVEPGYRYRMVKFPRVD